MTTRVPGAALALILALTLAACGGTNSSSTNSSGPSSIPAATAADSSTADRAAHNAVDVMFVTMMIPHHQGAIEMSDVALAQASTQQVKDLAARIKAAQGPEIEQMQSWLSAWGAEMPSATTDAGHDMGHGMMSDAPSSTTSPSGTDDFGMGDMMSMSEADMAALRSATGVEFDKLFLQQMISHHQGAIDMAEVEIARGENADVLALAASIKTGQTAEIAEMQQLLATL